MGNKIRLIVEKDLPTLPKTQWNPILVEAIHVPFKSIHEGSFLTDPRRTYKNHSFAPEGPDKTFIYSQWPGISGMVITSQEDRQFTAQDFCRTISPAIEYIHSLKKTNDEFMSHLVIKLDQLLGGNISTHIFIEGIQMAIGQLPEKPDMGWCKIYIIVPKHLK